MRFYPFSNAFGKKQGADEEKQSPSFDAPIGVKMEPQPTDDPMEVLNDIKRFGFAKRPDGTVIRPDDIEQGLGGLLDKAPSGSHDGRADAESTENGDDETTAMSAAPTGRSSFRMAHRLRPASDTALNNDRAMEEVAMPPQDAPEDTSDEPEAKGPLRRTAHTQRLLAELGNSGSETSRDAKPPLPHEEPASMPPLPGAAQPAPPSMDLGQLAPSSSAPAIEEPSVGASKTLAPPPALANATLDHQPPLAHDQDEPEDAFDDVAVTIGRVVSTRGSVVWGALFDDVGGQASKAARMGTLVSMRGPESRVFGIVNSLEREQPTGAAQGERTVFEIQILGEIADERYGFQRGVSSYPPLDAPITTVTCRDIGTIYARPSASNIHIGQLRHNPKVPAFALTDSLLGKHFAVLGTTGAGKSCAVTVILQSILREHPLGHIVLIDPHNEYGPAFGDTAALLNPGNLQLPYWLLNFEEIAHILLGEGGQDNRDVQSALLKDAIIHAKRVFAGEADTESQITVDTPVPYRLSDLVAKLKDGMGMLNKADGAASYLGLISRIESLRADKRYAFMFQSLAVRDNMEQILAQLLRIPTNGKPLTIIDISGLPSEIVDVVVSVLFRLTFELAVWSERGKAPPVLLVCEEAHRYVPEESGIGFAPTKRVISRIAKEGRKYGVTLCLVSQRPAELAINSLAQCNTVFALRLSNEHDQAFVAKTLSENSRWLVDSLPSLNTQEAVVVGDGVTVPVHIRFHDLPSGCRPGSHDPSFSASWRQETDDTFLSQSIDRWRRQTR